jgi:hypothetical protein
VRPENAMLDLRPPQGHGRTIHGVGIYCQHVSTSGEWR